MGEGLGLGRRGKLKDDGLINAIVFSCGSVATYLTGVDVQRWSSGNPPRTLTKRRKGEQKQQANQLLFLVGLFFPLLPIGQLDCWHKLDGVSLGPSGGSNLSLALFISRGSNDGVAILRVDRRAGGGRTRSPGGTRPIATSIS